ncbi:MAG: nuclear transport factor 2 family protein [Acidobacteria bacterium]|nr:nuclear transport factor 2 family protein [Acidobacteriota bacterium]
MNSSEETAAAGRKEQLRNIADKYFDALLRKDFSAIPYDNKATLRAPLAPGGVHHPLAGKDTLYSQWWIPLEPALEGVEIVVLDYYFNESLTAVCAEATITLNVMSPPVTLRVADRFTVTVEGKIIEQENHFDPRDVTNPGWQNG